MLIAMAGLPGAGKSTIAEVLGGRLAASVVSVDPIEASILRAGIDSDQPTGLAAYLVAETIAGFVLDAGQHVIVDAVNAVDPAREQWVRLAQTRGETLKFIEVVCSDPELHRERLSKRASEASRFASASTYAVEQSLDEYHPWSGSSAAIARITLDSVNPLGANVDAALAFLDSQAVLVLLPPSETKRDSPLQVAPDADESALDLSALGFPALATPRRSALAALRKLGGNRATMAAALKLGPSQQFEVDRNRAVRASATMPALERYTGVLYDALEVQSLDAAARAFADSHLVIHSALFGLLRGSDAIPAYRLSHDSKLPELSLKKLWRSPISTSLAAHVGLVLDLRSEAYVELGPAPVNSVFLRVVAEAADGRRRALNHFNKKGKGEFTRALVQAGFDHPDVDSLLVWAHSVGIRLTRGAPGELELVVPEVAAARRSA